MQVTEVMISIQWFDGYNICGIVRLYTTSKQGFALVGKRGNFLDWDFITMDRVDYILGQFFSISIVTFGTPLKRER